MGDNPAGSGPSDPRPEGAPRPGRQRPNPTPSMSRIPCAWACLGALAACSSGDGASTDSPSIGPAVTTFVAFERGNDISSIAVGDERFTSDFDVTNEGDGGLVLDYVGNAYQTNLRDSGFFDQEPGVHVLWRLADRSYASDTGTLTLERDRSITGFNTTLGEPREVAIAHAAGLIFVTDTADDGIKVWATTSGVDVAPIFTATAPATPWDVVYDEPNDRLFVSLMDASVAVYDDFVATQPALPARRIQVSEDGLAAAGTSFRGIVLVAENGADRLLIADVGPTEGNARDGVVWQIDGASTADGLVVPVSSLSGGRYGFGDPIDLAIDEFGGLRVADAGRGQAISIAPGFTPTDGSPVRRPGVRLRSSVEGANGIAIAPVAPDNRYVSTSDVDDPSIPIGELVIAAVPSGMNGSLQRFAADLTGGSTASFDVGQRVNDVKVDGFGDAYSTYTDGSIGGIAVIHRFVQTRGVGGDVAFDTSRDRFITNPPPIFFPVPTPIDPEGVDVDEARGLCFLADPAFPCVWIYGMCAGADGPEVVRLELGFSASVGVPRGVDYDPRSDTLYVAVSNGTVYAYDTFVQSPGEMPDRILTPSDEFGATQVSSDLASIVHDAERDLLIVADVGDTSGMSSDGALLVIEGASMGDGLTPVARTVTSAQLDEPLDLAWNGATLWVAENANGVLMRFDDFGGAMGSTAPTASAAVPDVTSVDLVLTGLAPTEGGSIDRD